jgi:hypothetical protein
MYLTKYRYNYLTLCICKYNICNFVTFSIELVNGAVDIIWTALLQQLLKIILLNNNNFLSQYVSLTIRMFVCILHSLCCNKMS